MHMRATNAHTHTHARSQIAQRLERALSDHKRELEGKQAEANTLRLQVGV